MPEYLAPSVYVEETSFRARSLEGVSTSTTAFAGPTRKGPVPAGANAAGIGPELLTSFGDFERVFGGAEDLAFARPTRNFLAHAVSNYFDNGGSRLYVTRVVAAAATAQVVLGDITVQARAPGAAGNGQLRLRLIATPATERALDRAPAGSLVRVTEGGANTDLVKNADQSFAQQGNGNLTRAEVLALPGERSILTLNVRVGDQETRDDPNNRGELLPNEKSYEDLGFDANHPRYVGQVLAETPDRRIDQLENPYALAIPDGTDAFAVLLSLLGEDQENAVTLAGGTDGGEPNAAAYADALADLARVEDISIVAVPGASAYADGQAIQNALIAHAEVRRAYRIAVLDSRPGITPGEARADRGQVDSTRAAYYYPWVVVSNPLSRPGETSAPREIALPPSGFVCGIYARNDQERGVFKAPANEVVRTALRFESKVNFAQQEILNPVGVNCLRFQPGRGYRVWGARTISSDPEWRYVNIRRQMIFLEQTIDRGTQWAVFEPNGERLWADIRDTVSSFLYGQWKDGALLGSTPEEAYFVRCDRSTMTQADLDAGRLICLVGVALMKPAEFVIFRIGQKTVETRT
jgi:phage tail sheath protein FI